ncbi:MAG: hypothetical protein WCE52_00210, partial [Candidatus Acidiferrum sp.]
VYVCNGERLVIDSCNMRDISDASTCMVGHPDTVLANGLMRYTTETRGALKKLLPTCKQPSAEQVAKAKAFEKKQNDLYQANEKKANEENDAIEARAQEVITGKKAQTPEERAIARCITSGRLPASCTGNALLGAFTQMITQVLPDGKGGKGPAAGPTMAGVFEGAGKWKLDFIDGGVLVNCAFLAPDQHNYKLEFENNRTALVIDTTPKQLVLTLRGDGTIMGPGPLQIDGVVVSGYTQGDGGSYSGGYHDQNGMSLSNAQAASTGGPVYDAMGNRVYSPSATAGPGHTTFAHKTATCPALNLSSKGASVGAQTMQTDLLKTAFGGDKGAPTPPGIRMQGIFAASTGFSVQFFPESAVLGCGPDAARAYPYNVVADGKKAVIHIAAADHPLTLTFKGDGALDPGAAGPYQVHGRSVTGQNNDGDFTFAPMERTCDLAVLTASEKIPTTGGAAGAMTASGGGGRAGTGGAAGPATLATAAAPLGNATLSVVSGLASAAGAPNALAGRPYVLLRDSYGNALAKGGVTVPAGTSPYKYVAGICGSRTPECQKAIDAINANAASAARADMKGNATFPGVAPGTYYLMISTRYNNQPLIWGQAVELKAGANSVTLDQRNAMAGN